MIIEKLFENKLWENLFKVYNKSSRKGYNNYLYKSLLRAIL